MQFDKYFAIRVAADQINCVRERDAMMLKRVNKGAGPETSRVVYMLQQKKNTGNW